MTHSQHILTVQAPAQGLMEITREVEAWVEGQFIAEGLLTLFIRHTSASLLIQENADPAVQRDLEAFFLKLVPENSPDYSHDTEGPDDMPAHIKGALTQPHLAIPVEDGRLLLGTWQGIYLFEHRRAPRPRQIVLHLIGD